VAGTRSLEVFESPGFASRISDNTQLVLRRLCLSHLIVTLSKWTELYDRYKAVIPREARRACLDLRKEIERRGIREFRNKVVGHTWDSAVKRPLTHDEIDTRLTQVLNGDQQTFLAWVNNPRDNVFPNTVVSICEETRERIRVEHGLNDSEIFP